MAMSQLLSISATQVLLDVIGILAIIGIGSFMIILVADLIISFFDKHQGVFFNRKKKQRVVELEEEVEEEPVIEYQEEVAPVENVEIIPLEEEPAPLVLEERIVAEPVQATKPFSDVLKEAAAIVAEEEKAQQTVVKEEVVVEEVVEEVAPVVVEEVVEETVVEEPVVVEKVVRVDNNAEVKKLRSLRKDILIKKQSNLVMDKENDRIKREYEEKLKELDELKQFKKRVQRNRANIIQVRNDALKKNNQLVEEKEQLKKEVESLKKRTNDDGKPYFTKEYYEAKLVRLEEELKENDKELKENKKELLPLRRVKKAYDRDTDRVRRKEVLVARQKVALYGVNSSANIDPAKKEKLDAEVKLLKELKDSVASCEAVLEENKDRLPALEKTNKVLTKHQEKLENDIATTKEALNWYAKNGSNK